MHKELTVKERVIARRLLRMMRAEALTEERNFVEMFAKRLGIVLDPPRPDAEQREEARATNKRAGRQAGYRRGFGG